jgi:hypothetical protein
MKDKKIERNLLEKCSRDYVQLQKKMLETSLLECKATRLALFEQNYKKK